MLSILHWITHKSLTQSLICPPGFFLDIEKMEIIQIQSTDKFVKEYMKLKICIRTSCKMV